MFSKTLFGKTKCKCDVCGRESDKAYRAEGLQKALPSWKFMAHQQSFGYRFFNLTCSDECRKKWRDDWAEWGMVATSYEFPLSYGAEFWTRNNSDIFTRMLELGERTWPLRS